jgi:hypothetical protein
MAQVGPQTGHKMKLYRNSGTHASPTWGLVSQVEDVSIPDLSRGLAELKRRASDFTKNLPSLLQTSTVEFRLHHGLDWTMFTNIRTDFFTGATKEWAVMDQAIANDAAEGFVSPYLVADFPWEQPLENVSGHDIRLATGYLIESSTEVEAEWLVVEV